MINFKKRLIVSLLAFPLIYILLYQKVLSNLLILIVFLFCIFEWVKIFKEKNAIFFLGLIVLFVFLLSLLRIYNFEEFNLTFLWLIILTWLSDPIAPAHVLLGLINYWSVCFFNFFFK